MGTLIEPVPVTGLAENFSPMPRMAPPPLGSDIAGDDWALPTAPTPAPSCPCPGSPSVCSLRRWGLVSDRSAPNKKLFLGSIHGFQATSSSFSRAPWCFVHWHQDAGLGGGQGALLLLHVRPFPTQQWQHTPLWGRPHHSNELDLKFF